MAATQFPQATAMEIAQSTLTLHTNSTPNDATEWLPAGAADRLRALRQTAADLHSLTVPFSEIQEANTARIQAQQKLKQLTDHQQDGGFNLSDDDRRVIAAQKHLDKMTAEYKRLTVRNETRTAAFTTAKQTETAVETWLRDGKPSGTVLEDFDGPEPQLLKNESITDGIERLRRRGRELKADLHRIRSTPFPSAHAKAKMRAEIEALAMRGAPSVSDIVENDRSVVWPTQDVRSQVYNTEIASVAFAELPDTLALFAWLHKSALIAALDREIATEADDKAALSSVDREKQSAVVLSDMLAVERDEAALVWRGMSERLPVEHRRDCSPLAILQCKLVTAPRANLSPHSTPGHSYEVRGEPRSRSR